MTCAMNVELGAYVLHALEEHEAAAVEHHLDGCDLCMAELHELEFTASLLSLLSAEDLAEFERHSLPPEHDVRRPPRRHRAVPLLVAAVLAAATALVPRTFVHHESGPSASVVRALDPTTHVRAAVSLGSQPDGTRLHLSLTGAYPKGWCSLVAHSRDGRSDTAATWRASAGGTADVDGMTAIPIDRLTELDVVTDPGHTASDLTTSEGQETTDENHHTMATAPGGAAAADRGRAGTGRVRQQLGLVDLGRFRAGLRQGRHGQ